MAATVSSPWSKPGAWGLDSEQSEPELTKPDNSADFPTLAAAAKAAKPAKKKKPQTLSLAEFTAVESFEPLVLPTGPRERSAEELDRNRLGGGFRSYGSGRDEPRKFRDSGRETQPPSRADEVDNWGAGKKFGGGFERSERRERDRGFFGESKADEVGNWVSSKVENPRRFVGVERDRRGAGFGLGNGGGADSDSWGRRKEVRGVGFGLGNGGGADSDNWGRKSEEGNGVGGRPRLVLQPRSLPVDEGKQEGVKPKGANPFGEARPREEVLKEKGQDWKEIDEKLDAVKIKEKEGKVMEREGSFGKRGFGAGGGRGNGGDDRIERSWRKPEAEKVADERPQSAETVENGGEAEEK